jgi:hypothetical protein
VVGLQSAKPHAQRTNLASQELVSLGPAARSRADPFMNGGRHLAPREFHRLLLEAAGSGGGGGGGGGAAAADEDGGGSEKKPIVLVDARNAYETEIGR